MLSITGFFFDSPSPFPKIPTPTVCVLSEMELVLLFSPSRKDY